MSAPLKALHIVNCEMGSVTSRKDHSVVFSVETKKAFDKPQRCG